VAPLAQDLNDLISACQGLDSPDEVPRKILARYDPESDLSEYRHFSDLISASRICAQSWPSGFEHNFFSTIRLKLDEHNSHCKNGRADLAISVIGYLTRNLKNLQDAMGEQTTSQYLHLIRQTADIISWYHSNGFQCYGNRITFPGVDVLRYRVWLVCAYHDVQYRRRWLKSLTDEMIRIETQVERASFAIPFVVALLASPIFLDTEDAVYYWENADRNALHEFLMALWSTLKLWEAKDMIRSGPSGFPQEITHSEISS
jgi:hypothetical protein